ncbi:hypothetical protein [Lysinibacillus sp. NPDC047702]|uniref:hypothetical protein n=1 Tax=unclassified Lysinibacillus TaxID=2636778 RepID=UPI003CFFB00A
MDKYVIVMMDGAKVSTTGVNLSTVATIFNSNNTIAAKIGKKSMSKHLVSAIVKMEAFNKTEDRNVTIKVGETLLFTNTTNPNKLLDSLTSDINKKPYAMVNDEILINRAMYQYAEVDEEQNTVETETQA